MEQSFRRQATMEAAEWFATLQQGSASAAEREQFARWLALSAQHVQEYLAVASAWRMSGDAATAQALSKEELIRAAQAQLGMSQVVPLHARRLSKLQRSNPLRAIAAAAAIVVIALVLAWMWAVPKTVEYQTHGGDRLTASLTDGSVVRLNTQTRIRLQLSSISRDVELVSGEALFEVAKDPQRPFRVLSNDTEIRAVGTAFNVQKRQDLTTVTVLEGKVLLNPVNPVESSQSAHQAIALAPRQQAQVARNGHLVDRRVVEVRTVTAWAQPQLRFSDEPLSEVIDLFNQYNSTRLVLEDRELAVVRVSGVFSSADVDSFVQYLKQTEHIAVERRKDGVRVLSSR